MLLESIVSFGGRNKVKRIYISLTIILIVVTASAVQLGFISGKADTFISTIEQIDKQMQKSNFNEAITLCNNMEDKWFESADLIDMLLIHDYVDEIGSSISKMRAYAENGSSALYFAESTSAKKELTSIKESEYPNLENVL